MISRKYYLKMRLLNWIVIQYLIPAISIAVVGKAAVDFAAQQFFYHI